MKNFSKELLEQKYLIEGKSWPDVAKELGVSRGCLEHYRKMYKIQSRINTSKEKQRRSLVGLESGLLTVISRADSTKTGHSKWNCICKCGGTKIALGLLLRRKHTTSCGCLRKAGGNKSKKWTGFGEISGSLWSSINKGAMERDFCFNITIEQAWDLFLKQNKKCAYTGVNLSFSSNIKKDGKSQTASLDRIDSLKGYTTDNVCWIHKDLNQMKMDFDLLKFVKWCSLVHRYRGKINPEYLEKH